MTMTNAEMLDNLLAQLETLLHDRGEGIWIGGVVATRSCLRSDNPNAFDDACRAYRNMSIGAGSFSDYYLHHENIETRLSLNRPLDALRADIETLVW